MHPGEYQAAQRGAYGQPEWQQRSGLPGIAKPGDTSVNSEAAESSRDPAASAAESWAQWEASRRRLERIKAEMANRGERQWTELFRKSEQVMAAIFANRRIMRDPEAHRILEKLRYCDDLETWHYELRCLARRLAEIAGQVPTMSSHSNAANRAGAADGKSIGMPSIAGRMHLRL